MDPVTGNSPIVAAHPEFKLDHDPSVADFTVSTSSYLKAHPNAPFNYIATSSLVVDTRAASQPRILLVQRAVNDSNPNRWEPPGGACDDEDPSIIYAAARELWEETGLVANNVSGLIGDPYLFTTSRGKKVCRFNFAVRLNTDDGNMPAVKLDPNEHQNFVWATEEEVKARKVDDTELVFTRDEVEHIVLLAFDNVKAKSMRNE